MASVARFKLRELASTTRFYAKSTADAVNALASVTQKQGRRGLRQAPANVGEAVSGGSDRAGAVAGAVQDAASSVSDMLADTILERPVASVALALVGLGFLVGVAWRR